MIPKAAAQRLKNASWLKRPETQRIFVLLDGPEDKTRAVGGVVRDSLLERNRDSAEIDFATQLLPDAVMRRAGEAGIGVYPTGIDHGTVTLKLGDVTAEVTTLRQDIETDGRHAKVKFGTDWRRDAERRDFTLNALYAGADGTLFDPLSGVEDCLAGLVRFIGDADQRIAEDRLRVYRFFRFSASHGHERFDGAGLDAVTRAAGTLGELSAERVGGEMRRMLDLPQVSAHHHGDGWRRRSRFPDSAGSSSAATSGGRAAPTSTPRLALLIAALGAPALKRAVAAVERRGRDGRANARGGAAADRFPAQRGGVSLSGGAGRCGRAGCNAGGLDRGGQVGGGAGARGDRRAASSR